MEKPVWLKKKIRINDLAEMQKLLRHSSLDTICREAKCPNIGECYQKRQASFLILGTACTRGCEFCNVDHKQPQKPDPDMPERLARAIETLGLRFVVITSPTRDDLPDGGASAFVDSIRAIRKRTPGVGIEVLIPDFQGNTESLDMVASEKPDIISHNLETIERLYSIRKGADYNRSLHVLEYLHVEWPQIITKSGIMVGLGEKPVEVKELLTHLYTRGCLNISIGQYLSPSKKHTPVIEFVTPEQFQEYRDYALSIGFNHIESAPYVRSSYMAENYLPEYSKPQK